MKGIPLRWRVARRDLSGQLASPITWLVLGAFASLCLVLVFRLESFVARGVADLRPLFFWIPLLLAPLCTVLSHGAWQGERRNGTLELLLAQPVSATNLVFGKFLARLFLVALALLLTAPLPVLLGLFSTPDWGPVATAYLAALLLGAAYLGIGLWIAARVQKAWAGPPLALLLCLGFYLAGTPLVTGQLDLEHAAWLRDLGAGARFASSQRGILDISDLYYFLSVAFTFLVLTLYTIERRRWSADYFRRHRSQRLIVALVIANLLLANVWLQRLPGLRLDATEGHQLTLAPATVETLRHLQAPLAISACPGEPSAGNRTPTRARRAVETSPLWPQLEDLLAEYAASAPDRVRLSVTCLGTDPGPAGFRVTLEYGEARTALGPRDLVDIFPGPGGNHLARLRNPQYQFTRAIHSLQSGLDEGNTPAAVALALPPEGAGPRFGQLQSALAERFQLLPASLASGEVDTEVEALVVLAPGRLDKRELRAIDNFLMRGATVLLATSPFISDPAGTITPRDSGLEEWLAFHGINIDKRIVTTQDPQRPDSFASTDIELRPPGLDPIHPVTAGLHKLNLRTVSPLSIKGGNGLRLEPLLRSSPHTRAVLPRQLGGDSGTDGGIDGEIIDGGQHGGYLLGAALRGHFGAYFNDAATGSGPASSPFSARLVLFSSNDFLADPALSSPGFHSAPKLVINALNWAQGETTALQIARRPQFDRLLRVRDGSGLEYFCYGLSALLLVVLAMAYMTRRRLQARHYRKLL